MQSKNITLSCQSFLDNKLSQSLYPCISDTTLPIQLTKRRVSQRRIRLQQSEAQKDEFEGSRLIVVMIGGVAFSEIRSLKELSVKYKKNITIIATSVNSPSDFLKEIVQISPPRSYDL